MSSIVKAVSDLFQSVLELLWSFVSTSGQLVEKTAAFALRSFNELLSLVVNFFRGLVDLAGGLVSFILGKQCPASIWNSGWSNIANETRRQHCRPRCHRRCLRWLLAIPAQPRQCGEGRQQEAELKNRNDTIIRSEALILRTGGCGIAGGTDSS
jgi:hypothetical protein